MITNTRDLDIAARNWPYQSRHLPFFAIKLSLTALREFIERVNYGSSVSWRNPGPISFVLLVSRSTSAKPLPSLAKILCVQRICYT